MFPGAPQHQLQQLWIQASTLAQQATNAEMGGNIANAAQGYESAAAVTNSFIATAQQYGIPINDQAWFNLSWCYFNTARCKTMLGRGAETYPYLANAEVALNAAINLNPYFGVYRCSRGVLLVALGRIAEAIQSFSTALQFNPADGLSRYMLAVLYQSQGNATMGNQYYAAAQQQAPALPPPEETTHLLRSQVQSGGGDKGFDFNNVLKIVGSALDVIGKGGDALKKWQGVFGGPSPGGHQQQGAANWPRGDWTGNYGGGGYGGGGYDQTGDYGSPGGYG